jgi:hypothetical protein
MTSWAYDASRQSLLFPGLADDFFQARPGPWTGAALAAEMARLAYVGERSRLDRYLHRDGFSLVDVFDSQGTQAVLARRADLSVLAFRGTESEDPTDLFTDARFLQTEWTVGGAVTGRVHTGFARGLEVVWPQVSAPLRQVTSLVVTGHSLGAALATLAASRVPTAHLYTFGSPRVGDGAFCNAVSGIAHERYVHCCDVVTRVPPEGVAPPYRHAGTFMYIDGAGTVVVNPPADKVDEDRRRASIAYLTQLGVLRGKVALRELADHAPINYVRAVAAASV